MVEEDSLEEEDEEEVAVAAEDEEDGISRITSFIKTNILTRSFKVHNSNNISQELSTDTAGRMEHVDTRQAYVMHQLRDTVTMQAWKTTWTVTKTIVRLDGVGRSLFKIK